MSKLIPRKLAAVIMCLSSLVAHAQSYYNDEYCDPTDPDSFDCDQIDTELIGDPFSGRGRCGTVEIESTLNGMYSTGSSAYPSTATVKQALAGAKAGVWYPWTFYEFFFPPDGTGCSTERVSWIWQVSIRTTNYRWTGDFSKVGWCEYTLWCAAGETATCGPAPDDLQYVEPDYSFGATGCATWYYDQVLALKESAGTYCLPVGVGDMAYIPYACT